MTARASRIVPRLRSARTPVPDARITCSHGTFTPQRIASTGSLRLRLWQIDGDTSAAVTPSTIETETLLEDLIEASPELVDKGLLIVGRQIDTGGHGRVDLLAIDRRGRLCVIELKSSRSKRDTTGQLVDYGAWATKLTRTELVRIYRRHSQGHDLEQAFLEKFADALPTHLAGDPELVLVASIVDRVTRENLEYLCTHEHPVRVELFQHFKVNGISLIARVDHEDYKAGHLSLRDESTMSPGSLHALAQRAKLRTASGARVQLHDYQDGLAEHHEQAKDFWDRFSPLFQWDFLMPDFLLAVHEKWCSEELTVGRRRMSLTQMELVTHLRIIVQQSGEWEKDYRKPAQFMKLHEPLAKWAGWVWDGAEGQSHGLIRTPR